MQELRERHRRAVTAKLQNPNISENQLRKIYENQLSTPPTNQPITNQLITNPPITNPPTKIDTIKVISYNVWWEAMVGERQRCHTSDHKNQCLRTIAKFIDQSQPDLLSLQEASCITYFKSKSPICFDGYLKDLSVYLNTKMYSKHSNSGRNEIVTFWNPNRFTKIQDYLGDTKQETQIVDGKPKISGGRPYILMIFKDKETQKEFAYFNLHFGHHEQKEQMKNLLKKYQKVLTGKRIILTGDFNHRLVSQSNQPQVSFGTTQFYKYPKELMTSYGIQRDHILDTQSPIRDFKMNILSTTSGQPPSDHHPVMAILEP